MIDKPIRQLLLDLNGYTGIKTFSSCSGHWTLYYSRPSLLLEEEARKRMGLASQSRQGVEKVPQLKESDKGRSIGFQLNTFSSELYGKCLQITAENKAVNWDKTMKEIVEYGSPEAPAINSGMKLIHADNRAILFANNKGIIYALTQTVSGRFGLQEVSILN